MNNTYKISGMTCDGCVASITNDLIKVNGVTKVAVSLEKGEVDIDTDRHIMLGILQSAISDKYKLHSKKEHAGKDSIKVDANKSIIRQLWPLFLIFMYLIGAVFLLNFKDWDATSAMLDFMGLFYIIFSFFKLLDLKGFSNSFRMYDPLAKRLPVYGFVYPFIELALGLMFLMRFQSTVALILTMVVLGLTTIGVSATLLDRKQIQCACLGTVLKLPMTKATFIENMIMLVMAITLLISNF
ncbi:MAG: heavy metal transporter [Maribacter sp.]|nr:cation transporter [Maribacter sp.]NNK77046.1 heavy metal transporter [Maribacter sp.]